MTAHRFPDEGQCCAADWAPKQWGHKCNKPENHPKSEGHHCRCGHTWTAVTPGQR